jgi:polysaccharide pyruvyl transferase WcaK-like protein
MSIALQPKESSFASSAQTPFGIIRGSWMKVVIANFTGERPNWGCQATSWELHKFCREILLPLAPVELTTVPNPPVHILDEIIERTYGNKIAEIFASPSASQHDLRFIEKIVDRRFGELAARVRDSDIVIFQGEGTMGPKRHFRGVRFFGLPFLAKQLWKKPVISLNQSFYATRPNDLRIARNVYKDMEVIALRESRSYSMCKTIGLEQTILCPDMAFRARSGVDARATEWRGKKYFCISGSAALGQYRLEEYISLLGEIARRHRIHPVFLHSKRKDSKLATLAKKILGEGHFDVVSNLEYPNYTDVLPILRGAQFVIGGRYHTSVMALAQTTPVVLLPGNTYKTEGLGQLLGIDIPVAAPSDAKAIFKNASAIMADREKSVATIASGLSNIEDIMKAFGNYLQAVTQQMHLDRPMRSMPFLPPILVPPPRASSSKNSGIYTSTNLGRRSSVRKIMTKALHFRTYLNIARSFRSAKVFLLLACNRSLYDSPETIVIQPQPLSQLISSD